MSLTNDTGRPRSLRRQAIEMLESIGQHRLLATGQLHALHHPTNTTRWTQRLLAELSDAGLVHSIGTRSFPPTNLWFLTEAGHDTVASAPHLETRRVQITVDGAAGGLQQHTRACNDVGIAFVTAARAHGDDCGPLAWRHEIAHPISASGESVISDAVLRYTRFAGRRVRLLTRFIEIDRATTPMEALADKLRRYARLWRYQPEGSSLPAWRDQYQAFPGLLVVFAGDKPRTALERRMHTALALAHGDTEITSATDLAITGVLLDDLIQHGPLAPVFRTHSDPMTPVDWLGQPPVATRGGDRST